MKETLRESEADRDHHPDPGAHQGLQLPHRGPNPGHTQRVLNATWFMTLLQINKESARGTYRSNLNKDSTNTSLLTRGRLGQQSPPRNPPRTGSTTPPRTLAKDRTFNIFSNSPKEPSKDAAKHWAFNILIGVQTLATRSVS